MAHPKIDNRTQFAVGQLYAADEHGRPLLVPLVQATYTFAGAGQGLTLAEEQQPPNLVGEPWGEDVVTSGYRLEPVFAFTKGATDVVLVGHGQSPRGPVRELTITFRVGPVSRVLRLYGDRVWVGPSAAPLATRPAPFERIPLSYMHAFGGWDTSSPDKSQHTFEPRNPVGVGFRGPKARFQDGAPLPNIEDPENLIKRYGQVVAPVGVGFISPHWQPRAAYAGTYDEAWTATRMPHLPKDFDRRFFSAASAGLVTPGYLRGDEPVLVEGASRHGILTFQLPGVPPPACRVALVGEADVVLPLSLDTLVVDTDRDLVLMLWRAHTPLRDGPHDVRSVEVHSSIEALKASVVVSVELDEEEE